VRRRGKGGVLAPEIPPTDSLTHPTEDEVRDFRDELSKFAIPLVRRYAGGRDIGAACGTLAATRHGGQVVG
jgi:23S rRNA (adenine2503-C2)-methyltransferase